MQLFPSVLFSLSTVIMPPWIEIVSVAVGSLPLSHCCVIRNVAVVAAPFSSPFPLDEHALVVDRTIHTTLAFIRLRRLIVLTLVANTTSSNVHSVAHTWAELPYRVT